MRTATLLLALLVFVTSGALSQQLQQPEVRRTFAMAGTFELGGSASFSSYTAVNNGSTSDASYSLAFSPTAGYFIIDELEFVVNPLMVSYAWSGSLKALNMQPMAGLAYNFRAHPRAFPYVEGVAGAAYSWSDNGISTLSRSGFAWAGRVGIKALITGTGIANIAVQYQQVTLNRSGDNQRNGFNQIALSVGLAVWL
jgi:hypothetical protein